MPRLHKQAEGQRHLWRIWLTDRVAQRGFTNSGLARFLKDHDVVVPASRVRDWLAGKMLPTADRAFAIGEALLAHGDRASCGPVALVAAGYAVDLLRFLAALAAINPSLAVKHYVMLQGVAKELCDAAQTDGWKHSADPDTATLISDLIDADRDRELTKMGWSMVNRQPSSSDTASRLIRSEIDHWAAELKYSIEPCEILRRNLQRLREWAVDVDIETYALWQHREPDPFDYVAYRLANYRQYHAEALLRRAGNA